MNERIKSAKASFGKMIFSKKECDPVNREEGRSKQTDKSNSFEEDTQKSEKFGRYQKKIQVFNSKKVKPCDRKVNRELRRQSESQTNVTKKEMMSDWTKNYERMCKRAQVLSLAIETADNDDLAVKPVTRFNTGFVDKNVDKFTRKKKIDEAESGSFFLLHYIISIGIGDIQESTSDTNDLKLRKSGNELRKRNLRSFYDTQSLDGIDIASSEPSSSFEL